MRSPVADEARYLRRALPGCRRGRAHHKDLLEERTSWQQRVHATLFHQGIPVVPKLGTADGQRRLDTAELSAAGRQAVEAGIRQIGLA